MYVSYFSLLSDVSNAISNPKNKYFCDWHSQLQQHLNVLGQKHLSHTIHNSLKYITTSRQMHGKIISSMTVEYVGLSLVFPQDPEADASSYSVTIGS